MGGEGECTGVGYKCNWVGRITSNVAEFLVEQLSLTADCILCFEIASSEETKK